MSRMINMVELLLLLLKMLLYAVGRYQQYMTLVSL